MRDVRFLAVTLVLGVCLGPVACGSQDSASEQTPPAHAAPPKPVRPVETPPPAATHAAPSKPPPKPGSPAPYPIILMHGMGGFNELENLPVTVSYFNGVQADLEAQGEKQVFVTIAPPFDTSEHRAAALKPQILAILAMTGAAKVNLIGHSQGGLDARVLASPSGLGMGDVVASVTTVATPHRGTPVADLALGLVSGLPASTVSAVTDGFLQLLENSVYPIQSSPNLLAQATEMTTSYMATTFNPKYDDAAGVIYASYAGRTNLESGTGVCDGGEYANEPSDLDVPQVELAATADYIQATGLDSDGLVPVESAKWGTFMECVPADHLKEVGMLFQNGADPVSGYDHLLFFRAVVARLRAEGL
jgi:triacylglycerol lipase